MENGNPLIRLEGIQKIFYTEELETHALEDIHLEIQEGEFAEVMGPSGCGKSTLLSLIGLLDTPTEGNYWLDGEPVSGLSATERARVRNKHIGFIFQAFNLIGDLTVFENVELPLIYGGVDASERKEKAIRALERVDMSHRMDHYPSQLSGGQRQRVAAARAVVGDPLNLLKGLHAEGSTILMVTHDPRYSAYAERTIHLFDGHITDEEVKQVEVEFAQVSG
jgi:putative ABC transport system ATP-binding protein